MAKTFFEDKSLFDMKPDELARVARKARELDYAIGNRAPLLGFLRGRRGRPLVSVWRGNPDYEDAWIEGNLQNRRDGGFEDKTQLKKL
ncbi:MAG: hypothetical protein AAB573_05295 [Patescibacteria group bacterium]